jgi:hypothetical protein
MGFNSAFKWLEVTKRELQLQWRVAASDRVLLVAGSKGFCSFSSSRPSSFLNLTFYHLSSYSSIFLSPNLYNTSVSVVLSLRLMVLHILSQIHFNRH